MLKHEEYENICKAIKSGKEMHLKHIVTHQVGKVVSCGIDDFFEVEVPGGEHKTWSKENVKAAN